MTNFCKILEQVEPEGTKKIPKKIFEVAKQRINEVRAGERAPKRLSQYPGAFKIELPQEYRVLILTDAERVIVCSHEAYSKYTGRGQRGRFTHHADTRRSFKR